MGQLTMAEAARRYKPIFVLGSDCRSTSMLSAILLRWGARACRQEPCGDHEPTPGSLTELFDRLGMSLWDVELSQTIRRQASDPMVRRQLLELAATMGNAGDPWFWEEQDLVFALPLLREVFPDAVYLIALQNPYDSALSSQKLWVPPVLQGKAQLIAYSLLCWQHFMVAICDELKDHDSKLLVSYEALLRNPAEQCARIDQFLAAEYGPEIDGRRDAGAMAQTINPNLWRNDSRLSFLDRPDVSRAQKDLFSYLSSRLDGDVRDFDPSLYLFPEWSREYCSNMAFMQWLLGSL